MKHIDSEIILQRKVGPLVYVYIMIIIVIVLFLIILFILCYYKTYYTVRGVVVNEEDYFYIRIYVPLDYVKYITTNNIAIFFHKNFRKYWRISEKYIDNGSIWKYNFYTVPS